MDGSQIKTQKRKTKKSAKRKKEKSLKKDGITFGIFSFWTTQVSLIDKTESLFHKQYACIRITLPMLRLYWWQICENR